MCLPNATAGRPGEVIEVPHAHVGLIIGREGMNIRDIQRQSGVRMHIAQEPDATGTKRAVTLIGLPDQVATAKHLIKSRLGENGPSCACHPAMATEPQMVAGSPVMGPQMPVATPPAVGGSETEHDAALSAGALSALLDPSLGALAQLQHTGVSVHVGRTPMSDGRRPVRVLGNRTTSFGTEDVYGVWHSHEPAAVARYLEAAKRG